MVKKSVEVDKTIKSEVVRLKEIDTFETDDTSYEIINAYKRHIEKQNDVIEELKSYKERQIDAFAIGDAISDGICVVDGKGIVTAINRGYTEITGIKEEEIVGRHIQDMLDKGYFNRAVSLMVLEQKKKISSLSTIGSSSKKVLITGNPFFNEQGVVIQVLTVMRDLTELMELKEKLEEAEQEKMKYLNELKYHREKQLNCDLIGESAAIQKIKSLIASVAKTDATVLITGGTGVGKEVVAREIYKNSKRKNGPYIKINCAAIPETLLESELFGYEKGSFTGAQQKEKHGLFEMANNGTILLDEIGEMPMQLQSKLLRVLQEKEIRRIGGHSYISVDVRVIAATNKNLQEQIRKGSFREDLYYRLNVIPIVIPDLKDRKEDIMALADNFLKQCNKKHNRNKYFDGDAVSMLELYDWPGNVRELQNIVERLVVVGDERQINKSDIVNMIGKDSFGNDLIVNIDMSLKEAVDMLEKSIIERTLKKYGSTHKAAKILGITQSTVVRKAKALAIEDW